jgi:hypothetical protein
MQFLTYFVNLDSEKLKLINRKGGLIYRNCVKENKIRKNDDWW